MNSHEIHGDETNGTAPSEDELQRAWEEVDRNWEEQTLHDRYLELGRLTGRTPEVGRTYREQKERPERRAKAEAQIERLLALTMATLTSATPTTHRRGRRVIVAVGFAIAFALAAIAGKVLVGGS